MKQKSRSSIDITLCSNGLANLCSNWRTDSDTLDLVSDHLPITFHIRADWSSEIKKQKIETWNLRNCNWESFRQVLGHNLKVWSNSNSEGFIDCPANLDRAVESWTECVVKAAKHTIGTKIILKGNKPW